MSKKKKLIPELRFHEFSENWDIVSVSDMCDVYRGGIFSKADMDVNGSEPCIHYGELFTKYNEVISAIYSKTNKSDGFKSKVGDILMPSSDVTPDGLAKASAIMLDDVVLGGDMNILRPKKKINSIFLSYLLNHTKREIIKLVSGTTVKHIYPSQIITCQLPIINNKSEQQKIASCLSSLDDMIEAHNQKLELLKDHKKGLMQNLFPTNSITNDQLRITEDNDQFVIRNSQTRNLPKVRFKEFEKNGEWVEKKLGDKDVAFIVNEKTSISKLNIETYISTENMLPDFTGVSAASKLPPTGSFTKFKIGDILISNIRPYLKKVWKSDKIGGASNDVIVFRSSSGVLSEFLEFLIKNETFINYVMESAKGVKMPRGDKDSMLNYPVFIPTKEEQIKIGSCLSSLDEIITAQTEKIEQLKHHKKGLMQGLFPKMIDI